VVEVAVVAQEVVAAVVVVQEEEEEEEEEEEVEEVAAAARASSGLRFRRCAPAATCRRSARRGSFRPNSSSTSRRACPRKYSTTSLRAMG
jgi:hypothetical protein